MAESRLDNTENTALKRKPEEIEGWLVKYLADLLDMGPDEVDLNTPVERYGLDSAAAIGLVSDLGDWLGVELEPTVVYDHRTIGAISAHVAAAS